MNKKLGRLLQPNFGIYFVFLAGFALAAALMQQYALAVVEALLTAVVLTGYLFSKRKRRRELQNYLNSALNKQIQTGVSEPPFPMAAVRLTDGGIIHANEGFCGLTGHDDVMSEHRIQDYLPGFSLDWLRDRKTECPHVVTINKRYYRVYGTIVRTEEDRSNIIGALYFADLTELHQIRDEYIRSRPVVSLILVDNYEELTKNLTEAATSSLNAKLDMVVTQWAERYHGLLRRLERGRYLLIFEKRDLNRVVEDKFSLLEEVHQITNPSGLASSISIGMGVDASDFVESYSFASLSIEMALSRGGDQAVIKDRFNFTFYGGRTKESDHRSKVRSRVTANSMMELIGQSSHVFVMGHRNADLDAVGAALGICCMCRKKGKQAYIVLDMEENSSQRLLEEIVQVPEYKNVFISGQEAMLRCDNHSTLVVVDTNRPDQVEYRPLLEAISRVCVVDHHRRAADYINPVVVNLHEPYASSAAELVTELLEYAVEKSDVLPIEAKSLLAGIFLDTKSFNVRTGQRTFEAAAFLRQLGAEPVEVKKLLQNDFQDTMAKYQIIKSARLYKQEIAIAALNSTTSRPLAAQAADELLNISGISASFVLYPDGSRVIVSGRSNGDANVQMILEPLGGGGNAATAGAQMKGVTVKEAVDELVASIDRYYEG